MVEAGVNIAGYLWRSASQQDWGSMTLAFHIMISVITGVRHATQFKKKYGVPDR